MKEAPKDKRAMCKFHGKDMPFTYAIHIRMVYHYAVMKWINWTNFDLYFRTHVLPNFSLDKPYIDKDAWLVDGFIKGNYEKVMKGFEKSVAIMGEREFQRQVAQATEDITDNVKTGIQLGMISKPKKKDRGGNNGNGH